MPAFLQILMFSYKPQRNLSVSIAFQQPLPFCVQLSCTLYAPHPPKSPSLSLSLRTYCIEKRYEWLN